MGVSLASLMSEHPGHHGHPAPHHGAAASAVAYHPHPTPSEGARPLAVRATVHCLTGCAIGEILGLVLATAFGWANGPSIAVAIVLAFGFGYGLTALPLLRSGLRPAQALRLALAADTLSILTMEVVDNGVVLAVPGAMDAGLRDALFWGSLAFSLVVAFLVTVPVNRWLIGRGQGRAVVHSHH